ncbi:MAG: acetyl-CoA carboxylase biotin carboxyl carrier protein [Chthoniobacterales bacterium]|nr:acetyl-CoA carboxylase biotin carboxyl carrier protein [Chthoniobacterales bacterium]
MEIKEIRTLVDLMKKNGLAVFQMEQGDFKITLKTPEGAARGASFIQGAPSFSMPTVSSALNEVAAPVAVASVPAPQNYKEILSPMVGTFYTAASPESPAFVEVGQEVNAQSVVCIIEAMKVMNEIKAEIAGKIVEVVAQNGKPVQFGEVLFRVS